MLIKNLAESIEDEVLRKNFLEFFKGKEKGAIDVGNYESVDPLDLIERIVGLSDDNLKNLLLFYISSKSFMKQGTLFDFCYECLENDVDKRELLSFRFNIFPKMQAEYDSFCIKKQQMKKDLKLKEFKNSLTEKIISEMFEESKLEKYHIFSDFLKANNLDSIKVKILEETLIEMDKQREIEYLNHLRKKSLRNSRNSFMEIEKTVHEVYDLISKGVKKEDGTTRPFTLLEFYLNYNIRIRTFMDFSRKLGFSNGQKCLLIKFFKPAEMSACSKEELFKDNFIFFGHEVTDEDKEKAYSLLKDNKIKPTYILFKQALKVVI